MMKAYLIIFLFFIALNVNAQWIFQTTGVSVPLWDIEFINENTGWVCGEQGVILKTTNGGNVWEIQNTGINNKVLYGIYPVNDSVVYCVGFFETILKTTNGGENWIAIENGPAGQGDSYYSVFFLNEDTGWIGSNSLATRKTTDGGSSFNNQFIFTIPRDLFFKDAMNGAGCGWGATIGTTTNGGNNWNVEQYCTPGLGCEDFYRFSFIDDFTGFVVGRSGTTLRTTDFGFNWDSVGFVEGNAESMICSRFKSDSIGWAGGTSYLFKSTNGGVSWKRETPTAGYFTSIYAINDSIVWACGNPGRIWHTKSGGDTTVNITQIGNEIPSGFALKQNYPNPFNPSTNIQFDLPKDGFVTLKVYDVSGREVETLVNEFKKAGSYIAGFNASHLSSGVYFYKINAGGFEETRRMILVK